MSYDRAVLRSTVIACVLLAANVASADPASFELDGIVNTGKKPQLTVTASEKLTDIRLELEREDGKKLSLKHASLASGQSVTFPLGDGAAGQVLYKGTLSAAVTGGKRWSQEMTFTTLVKGGALKITYDAEHLDLDNRLLEFKPSYPAASAELVVFGEDGSQLGKGAATYKNPSAGGWESITWTQPANARVMTMKLRVVAKDGQATNVELIPWSVNVDHEDVNFRTDSAKIDADETKKLDASLAKIKEVVARTEKVMPMRLYIAGHTDTVGPGPKNRKLSFDRAAAIATYFRKQGLKIPIAVAGYGEDVLKVKTADNTDERANRRVDYVIGPASGAPPFKGPYLQTRADWKQLK